MKVKEAAASDYVVPLSGRSPKISPLAYSRFQDILHLFLCAGGIYLSYLAFGVVQERLFKIPHGEDEERFSYVFFLVFTQCCVNGASAFVVMAIQQKKDPKVPLMDYSWVAAAYIGAMLCSNAALGYVNYPTQVLGKSCKMIPVMLIGVLINRKKYSRREYLHVFMISLGIAIFMGFQSSSKQGNELRIEGVILLLISLALDGFTGPLQERIIVSYSPSVHHMMFFTNALASVICLIVLMLTTGLAAPIAFCIKYPDVFWDIFLFCVLSAVGQNFIFATLFRFNSLVLSTVTTTRKFFTILFSVLWFGNPVNPVQWIGVSCVFGGLGLNILAKFQNKKQVHNE